MHQNIVSLGPAQVISGQSFSRKRIRQMQHSFLLDLLPGSTSPSSFRESSGPQKSMWIVHREKCSEFVKSQSNSKAAEVYRQLRHNFLYKDYSIIFREQQQLAK